VQTYAVHLRVWRKNGFCLKKILLEKIIFGICASIPPFSKQMLRNDSRVPSEVFKKRNKPSNFLVEGENAQIISISLREFLYKAGT
jgi:hypothetical protein